MPRPTGPRPAPRVKVGQRLVSLGIYGFLSSLQTDFWKVAKDMYERSNYTGAMFHIQGPWCQVPNDPNFPFAYDPSHKIFDMGRDNEMFYTKLSELLDAFEWYGLDVLINFDDQYCTSKWVADTKAKLHPYQQNTFHVRVGDEKDIYDSITLPGNVHFWLDWDDINESQNKFKFRLVGDFGKARARMFARVMDTVHNKRHESRLLYGPAGNPMSQHEGDPTWRIFFRRANEEIAKIDPATGDTSHALSLGDRSEIYAFMYEMLAMHELSPNWKNLFCIVNRNVAGGTASDQYRHYTVINRDIQNAYGHHFGMNALHEIHINGVIDRNNLLKYSQIRLAKTFLSNDGMPKQSAKQFTADSRALFMCHDPWFDQLYEEGGEAGEPNMWGVKIGEPHETMKNWDLVAGFHFLIVK